ncbi:MAG: hypothetical protein JWR70_307 [Modestobacter sp.]|jgi:hypothetical protein|nr:hypothetical protein [Modestobacter sp.]
MRVHDALCGAVAVSRDARQIRQALIDDLTAAPTACLPAALAELHAVAVFLFSSSAQARGGFRHTGVESQLMEDELAALAYKPWPTTRTATPPEGCATTPG